MPDEGDDPEGSENDGEGKQNASNTNGDGSRHCSDAADERDHGRNDKGCDGQSAKEARFGGHRQQL
ncbi:MAG: hypothetical protein M3Q48_02650 [Actinomycetota bacterium]|nr:hypothetical protein [Actinomycetota bacterium]